MKLEKSILYLTCLFLVGCIGDDFIDDFVEPELRVTNLLDTLSEGQTYQLEVQFFNNVGSSEDILPQWASSEPSVALVNEEGVIWARKEGQSFISASVPYEGDTVKTSFELTVAMEMGAAITERTGSLRTTSTYALQGDFVLSEIENGVKLSIDESYLTDDVLPGLYIYLTNNANSVANALVIQEVTVFEGAHEYDIPDVGLNDYSHVLYFCKPFNVKVGDGKFEE